MVGVAWLALTGEEQPQLSSHVLRDALEDELLGLLRAVHAHALTVLGKVVLPRLLFQELFRLCSKTKTKRKEIYQVMQSTERYKKKKCHCARRKRIV